MATFQEDAKFLFAAETLSTLRISPKSGRLTTFSFWALLIFFFFLRGRGGIISVKDFLGVKKNASKYFVYENKS